MSKFFKRMKSGILENSTLRAFMTYCLVVVFTNQGHSMSCLDAFEDIPQPEEGSVVLPESNTFQRLESRSVAQLKDEVLPHYIRILRELALSRNADQLQDFCLTMVRLAEYLDQHSRTYNKNLYRTLYENDSREVALLKLHLSSIRSIQDIVVNGGRPLNVRSIQLHLSKMDEMTREYELQQAAKAQKGSLELSLKPRTAHTPNISRRQVALDLMASAMDENEKPSVNAVFSQASLDSLLALVGLGFNTETRTLLEQYLGRSVDETLQKAAQFEIDTPPFVLLSANNVWTAEGFTPKSEFRDGLSQKMQGLIPQTMNVNDPAGTAKDINDWIGTRTDHKLGEVVTNDKITPDLITLFVNTLFFDAPWLFAFDVGEIRTREFAAVDLEGVISKIGVETLRKKNNKIETKIEKRTNGETIVHVRLPYVNEDFAMYLSFSAQPQSHDEYEPDYYQPNPAVDILKVYEKTVLNGSTFEEGYVSSTLKDFYMPTFKVTSVFDVLPVTDKNGFDRLSSTGQLTNLTDDKRARVSFVVQKITIGVGPVGTQIAVATAGGATLEMAGPRHPSIDINGPFAFAVRNDKTGEVIAEGVVRNPGPAAAGAAKAEDQVDNQPENEDISYTFEPFQSIDLDTGVVPKEARPDTVVSMDPREPVGVVDPTLEGGVSPQTEQKPGVASIIDDSVLTALQEVKRLAESLDRVLARSAADIGSMFYRTLNRELIDGVTQISDLNSVIKGAFDAPAFSIAREIYLDSEQHQLLIKIGLTFLFHSKAFYTDYEDVRDQISVAVTCVRLIQWLEDSGFNGPKFMALKNEGVFQQLKNALGWKNGQFTFSNTLSGRSGSDEELAQLSELLWPIVHKIADGIDRNEVQTANVSLDHPSSFHALLVSEQNRRQGLMEKIARKYDVSKLVSKQLALSSLAVQQQSQVFPPIEDDFYYPHLRMILDYEMRGFKGRTDTVEKQIQRMVYGSPRFQKGLKKELQMGSNGISDLQRAYDGYFASLMRNPEQIAKSTSENSRPVVLHVTPDYGQDLTTEYRPSVARPLEMHLRKLGLELGSVVYFEKNPDESFTVALSQSLVESVRQVDLGGVRLVIEKISQESMNPADFRVLNVAHKLDIALNLSDRWDLPAVTLLDLFTKQDVTTQPRQIGVMIDFFTPEQRDSWQPPEGVGILMNSASFGSMVVSVNSLDQLIQLDCDPRIRNFVLR